MIRVTVELVSAIDPIRNRVLGVAEIVNDGVRIRETGGKRGSYIVRLSQWAPSLTRTWRKGRIGDFDRRQRGPWDLLFLALRTTVGARNPDPHFEKRT